MDFVIPDASAHAAGYLARRSFLNLLKRFVIDEKYWDGSEGRWLRLRSHYVNGRAFGGLVGRARSFGRLLRDLLGTDSVLLGKEARRLLETRQTDGAGRPIPMTLGWHVGRNAGATYFFKEGAGGGYHSEMRVYPSAGIGSVVMTNSTGFRPSRFLNRVDAVFLEAR